MRCLNKRLRAILTGARAAASPAAQTAAFSGTKILLRAFYGALALLGLHALLHPQSVIEGQGALAWPALWARWTGAEAARTITTWAFLSGSVAACAWPDRLLFRVAACAGLWTYAALMGSLAHLFPALHHWVLAALMLLFLPEGFLKPGSSRRTKQETLTVFWGAQALVLSTYTMAALSKLWCSAAQAWRGETSMLSIDGLATQVAAYRFESGFHAPLSDAVLQRPWLGWLLVVATLFIQGGALAAAFRPKWHRAWGLALIGFHLGTWATIGMFFQESVLLLAILIVASPFQNKKTVRH